MIKQNLTKIIRKIQFERFIIFSTFQENGLDDERIKYYPFREDAKEILSLFKAFVHKFVQTYYGAHNSNSIRDDKELQAMANEISIHGTKKPDGGKGKVMTSLDSS